MTDHTFTFQQHTLSARASGTLLWPAEHLLCVSDLHFGKAQRYAAQGGASLPPYDTLDTLARLNEDIEQSGASTVICLGDSFDAIRSGLDLDSRARDWITRLQAGRRWIWIEGNHDPGPVGIGGTHLAEVSLKGLTFRHIAQSGSQVKGEISGHFHPKAHLKTRGGTITRRCFAYDTERLIMPAFGTYTGGLDVTSDAISNVLSPEAICVLLGQAAQPVPKRALAARHR